VARQGKVLVGTSGWHYGHWRGRFYPDELAPEEWLAFYAARLPTVEINNSFYQLPAADTVAAWREQTPPAFTFAAKASRYITHLKKLKDPARPVAEFFERLELLRDKLGPTLFQLPPRWRRNAERLRAFLAALPEGRRCAFEFRDESWFDEDVYEALRERGAAFCIYDLAGRVTPKEVTAAFVYVRLHGPAEAYEGGYDARKLAAWAGALASWARQGRDVYCYFNNDQEGYAVRNALRLREMVEG
jgi:uncharacterized protein YecE (DUF72 family)